MEEFILSLNELDKIVKTLPKKGIILLQGDLASGKTTLVKSIAKHLNVNSQVNSPTFSILQKYDEKIYHYDIFHDKTEGFLTQGLFEELQNDLLHLVEWADDSFKKLLQSFAMPYVVVYISQDKDNFKRIYKVDYAHFKS